MEVIDPEGAIFKKMFGDIEGKTVEENTEIIGVMVTTEVGIGQEKGHSRNYGNNRDRSSSNSRLRSGSRAESMIILQGTVPPLEK